MRPFILLLLTLSVSAVQAQYDDLLQNPGITWVAEHEADYELNPAYTANLESEYNLLEVIRIIGTRDKNGLYPNSEANLPFYLSKEIYEGIRAGSFECFADAGLTQPLNTEQIQASLIWKDSTDESGFVLENEYTLESFVTFRVRQVLYYSGKDRRLGARLLAIAPVAWVSDEYGNMIQHQPVLWIKLPALTARQQRRFPKTANYALQTLMKDNTISMDQVEIKKGSFDTKAWATQEVQSPKHKTLSVEVFEPLSPAALKAHIFTTDTVTSINDQGQSVIDRIIQQNALEDVQKLRLVQNWYYDERLHALDCRLVAVAPMATISAAGGLFEFDKPLFYVKY
ncbi:MAG: hypothetical protein EP344_03730 [Bacteroidetes bacterium]|nr:MAG: hypothetical protein EP344_03730 [Bacteroidota bacterium]